MDTINLDRDLRADPDDGDDPDQRHPNLTAALAAVRADLAALHVPPIPAALAVWITAAGWTCPPRRAGQFGER